MPWKYFNPLPHLSKVTSFEQLLTKQDRKEIDDLCKKIRIMWTSEPLTPLQRITEAMKGSEVDRVPCGMYGPIYKCMKQIGGKYIDIYKNPVLQVKASLMTTLEFKLDAGLAYHPIDMNFSDVFGTKFEFLENSLPKVSEWAVKKGLEEIVENDLPDLRESEALRWQILTTTFLNERLGDLSSFSFILLFGPYYMYNSCLRGPKEGFFDIKKNPDLAYKAFDKLCDYLIGLAKYLMKEIKIPPLYNSGSHWELTDSLAGPSFTPPDWYEKFCAPFEKRIVEELAPAPGTISGGGQGQSDFTALLDRFSTMGFKTLMFGPPTDLKKIKELSREKGIYIAGWDVPSPLMRYGTPQQIEDHVKECIRIAGPGGRYTLGTDLPDHDSPDENILAVKQAVLKYGKYPLKFE